MKTMLLNLTLGAALFQGVVARAELPADVTIPRSQVLSVSSHVNGASYQLSVFLPRGYESGEQRYPTLYVIDDQVGRDVAAAARELASTHDMPPAIVVAIGFTTPEGYWQDLPTIEPGERWEIDEHRGAAHFLTTLLEDIKPRVDRSYRTDPVDTGLAGHSLGGFFTLYATFHAPGTFRHVWSSSPSMIWNHAVLLKHADELVRHPEVQARVFTSVGREEDLNMTAPLEQLNRRMEGLGFAGLSWHSALVDHENHSTVEVAMARHALQDIYGRGQRQPSLAEMQALTGRYRLDNGHAFSFAVRDGRLVYASDDGSYDGTELQTYAPDQWIIRGTGLRFDIRRQADGRVQVLLTRAPSPGPKGEQISPPMLAVPETP